MSNCILYLTTAAPSAQWHADDEAILIPPSELEFSSSITHRMRVNPVSAGA